ncbi:decorin [Chanos chanos]|uniref:Decorin n=1 Tax=Chanos chanos TaxID=29144 RepID=A0A6J2VXB4_CHACN|nr:decorin-like [Chanos chanos]
MTDNPMTQPGKKDATVSTTMAARRALTFKAVPSTQQARDHKAHQKKLTAKSKSKQTTKAKKAKKAKMPRKEKETKAKPLKKVQKTRKSKQEKKENPTAPPYFPYFKENYCPPECACYGRVVQCSDKGIEKIPYGIPYNSRYILLMNNRIDSIQLDLLPEYIHLEFLVLSNNRLTDGAIEGAFEGIQGLKRLYMDHNLLQSVPTDLPSSLEELRLDDNQLSVMSEAAWGRCSNLMVLSLSNNSLGNLSDPLPAGVLSSLGSLRTLNLNHNQLDSVPLQLPLSLQELYLRGNHIQRLPASVFQGQTKLLVLDLSVNWLTDKGLGKGVLAKASHLESLNLEGNRLRQVPRHLPASLKTLNLEGNAISSVGKSAFLGLPQLELLGLGKNKIARVAPTAFLRLPHLHQLDLSHNNLRQVPRKLPPWLHTASLAHNKITEVPRDAFCWGSPKPPLSRLTSVQLENNLLDMGGLNGSAFRCLRGFQVVHFY